SLALYVISPRDPPCVPPLPYTTLFRSFAHDIYANVIKKGRVEDSEAEVKIARRTVIVIGAVAIIGGIGVQGQNIAFLVALERDVDRKSTRLHSSHVSISYAVFCLKKTK